MLLECLFWRCVSAPVIDRRLGAEGFTMEVKGVSPGCADKGRVLLCLREGLKAQRGQDNQRE